MAHSEIWYANIHTQHVRPPSCVLVTSYTCPCTYFRLFSFLVHFVLTHTSMQLVVITVELPGHAYSDTIKQVFTNDACYIYTHTYYTAQQLSRFRRHPKQNANILVFSATCGSFNGEWINVNHPHRARLVRSANVAQVTGSTSNCLSGRRHPSIGNVPENAWCVVISILTCHAELSVHLVVLQALNPHASALSYAPDSHLQHLNPISRFAIHGKQQSRHRERFTVRNDAVSAFVIRGLYHPRIYFFNHQIAWWFW